MKIHPFLESQDLLTRPTALRERLDSEGYLFFRNLLDPNPLYRLLNETLDICERYGWLADGSTIEAPRGRADAYEGHFENTPVYREMQRLQSLHSLAHSTGIISVLGKAMGEPVFPHPRNIARITLPDSSKLTTPSHQDYVFIQGSQKFHTVWFPLSDCPKPLGGLIVARGSHKSGIMPVQEEGGRLCAAVDDDAQEWHGSDYNLGDVLMFNSLTLHKAHPNVTSDLLRVSCDFRYQPLAESLVTWDTLNPHIPTHSWEDIYSNWGNDELKLYWHKYKLQVVPARDPREVTN